MRTHRVARLVAILLFLAALVYFCGGMAVGLPLWSRGLGEGWGSGFSGWLAIPILAGTLFGAITLLVFGAILYFLARIDTNLTTAQQNPPAPAIADEAALAVPPEPAPVPVEPIVVGVAAATTDATSREEAPPPALEAEANAAPEAVEAGGGAVAAVTTAVVAGAVAAGVAATHKDEAAPAETEVAPDAEAETLTAPEPAETGGGAATTVAAAGAVAAGVAVVAAYEDDTATAGETTAAPEAEAAPIPAVDAGLASATASAAVPQVEIGPQETPKVAEPKLSGLDALLIGLGRVALGQQPDKPAEGQPSGPATAEAAGTPTTTPPPDLQAELPAVVDATPQEFTGKLPGVDEAARIASEMSGGEDSSKPEASK